MPNGKTKSAIKQNGVKKLSLREQRLVSEMAQPNVNSPEKALIAAGYAPTTARKKAWAIVGKPHISEAIENRRAACLAHHQVTPEEVLGSAVRQMRSSMDDVLDEKGSFSIEKARDTGAIDFLKKHKETTRTVVDREGRTETVKTVEIELMTNQDGRKEVGNYIGLENFAGSPKALTSEDIVRELYRRLCLRDPEPMPMKRFCELTAERFPEVDVTRLLSERGV